MERLQLKLKQASAVLGVEPIFANVADWFAELDRLGGQPFMVDGRHQPRTPEREIFTS